MKKIFYALLFSLGIFLFLTQAKAVNASKCTINEVTYDLPKTIGIVSSHTISEYDDFLVTEELPSSFSGGITMIVIENKNSCESVSNYEYYLTSRYFHQLKRTDYTYHNILVDTNVGSSWSYSQSLPQFSTIHKHYSASYTEIAETVTMYYYANVGTLTTIDALKSYLIAEDNLDGILSSSITLVSDQYSSNYNFLGEYPVRFSVTDSSSNTTEFIINVVVRDVFAPTISGPATMSSFMSEPLNISSIKDSYTAIDNYDPYTSLLIESDAFTGHEYEKGSYEIIFSSTDSSLNKALFKLTVMVIDDIKPTIEGVKNIIKGNTSSFNKAEVLSLLRAYDNIDGSLTNSIVLKEDTYSLNERIIGNYYLSYIVTDSSFNTCEPYYVYISVYDSIPPVFNVDENIIITDTNTIITNEQIINLFIRTNQISEEDVTKLTLIEDTYNISPKEEGDYTITYSFEKDGEVRQLSLRIKVNKNETKKKINKMLILIFSGSFSLFLTLFYIFKRFVFIRH